MSEIKKSETPTPLESGSMTPSEEQQLAQARARRAQGASKATPADSALTKANATAVTQTSEAAREEELKTEAVQQQTHVQSDLDAARRLGTQIALAERHNDEATFAAYQQTKALIEEELGAAPQIFRRYSEFERINFNELATEQFSEAGLKFSENADLSALAERLLGPADSERASAPTSSKDSVA